MAEIKMNAPEKGQAMEVERRSFEFFEKRRMEIVKACSAKLGIPLEEFAYTNDTAAFHLATVVIAAGEWVVNQGIKTAWPQEDHQGDPVPRFAFMKAVSSLICRLTLHLYGFSVSGDGPEAKMLMAFIKASDPHDSDSPESTRRIVAIHALIGCREICRYGLILGVTKYWETGELGALVHDHFNRIEQFLDEFDSNKDDSGFFPAVACKDAYSSLFYEMQTLIAHNDEITAAMPRTMAKWDEPGAFALAQRYLSQYSLFRQPIAITSRFQKIEPTSLTFADALRSLGGKNEFALIESGNAIDGLALPIFHDQHGNIRLILDCFKNYIRERKGNAIRFVFLDLALSHNLGDAGEESHAEGEDVPKAASSVKIKAKESVKRTPAKRAEGKTPEAVPKTKKVSEEPVAKKIATKAMPTSSTKQPVKAKAEPAKPTNTLPSKPVVPADLEGLQGVAWGSDGKPRVVKFGED